MAIVLQFEASVGRFFTAVVDGGKWYTNKESDYDGLFEGVLNDLLELDMETGDYGTIGEPDVDYLSAIAMSRRFAGEITDISGYEPPEHGEIGRDRGNGIKVLY